MSEMLDQLGRNERQEWDCDYDHDLHVAWVSVAMGLAAEYAEAYCNHRTEDDRDYLQDFIKARRELHQHLLGQPASMGPEGSRVEKLQAQLAEAQAKIECLIQKNRALRHAGIRQHGRPAGLRRDAFLGEESE